MNTSIIRTVGTEMGIQTLLGVVTNKYPIRWGNDFTLKMHDNKTAWVKNISAEDFKEICERENILAVEVLYFPDEGTCFVIDARIPRTCL